MFSAGLFSSLRDKLAQQHSIPGGKLQPPPGMMSATGAQAPVPVPGPQAPAPAPQPVPPPANPFAPLMEQAAAQPQGFARPEAQQWMQQALGSPYMQGWGNGIGGASPAAPASPGQPGQDGSPFQMLAKDIVPSDDAYKLRKNYRRAKDAKSFNLKDIGKIGLSVGLGALTGGLGAAAMAGATGLYGAKKEGKLGKMGVKATKRMWNEYLPQAGFTKKGKGWYDAEGTRISTLQAMQVMLDMGAFG